ncbi:acetylglutamate kinase [bacterium]|nr:acetylglutamate kinase [bacterium]
MSVVIKIGGSVLQDSLTISNLTQQLKKIESILPRYVLLHGGGPAIAGELSKLGLDFEFVNGVRRTTEAMMPAVEKALWDVVNAQLSRAFDVAGISHKRLCGFKDKILLSRIYDESLGLVGEVTECRFEREDLQRPVLLSPMGVDEKGAPLNVNADFAAQEVAVALKAKTLIFLSDQKGVLNLQGDLFSKIDSQLARDLIDQGVISGGMRAKVEQICVALSSGVGEVVLLDGRSPDALIEYFEESKLQGTKFVN